MEEQQAKKTRRKRRVEIKMEDNVKFEIQKTIENFELPAEPNFGVGHKVVQSKSDLSVDSWKNRSESSENRTYSLSGGSDGSGQGTYNIDKPEDFREIQPVPAPRRRRTSAAEREKVSSDTDKDVTEIDLDERADISENNGTPVLPTPFLPPVPKPRKTKTTVGHERTFFLEEIVQPKLQPFKSRSLENLTATSKKAFGGRTVKSDAEVSLKLGAGDSNELPLISKLEEENLGCQSTSEEAEKQQRNFRVGRVLGKKEKSEKGKKGKVLGKLDTGRIAKISSILRDLRDPERKDRSAEEEEEEEYKTDFQIDSPRYPESSQNGKIYVQNKNGFSEVRRDEVLGSGNGPPEGSSDGGAMESSTVKMAILFQKYWSRSMMYFHGVLAGFAFSHAATVTAIMLHYNYSYRGFIDIYVCLSYKIHFVFYTLTTLCILSCFDRIDVGHMNRRHWQNTWKVPSMWFILSLYILSFALTFVNQKTEARFDAYIYVNETENKIWDFSTANEIQTNVLSWYHIVWTRDFLVLFAWLVIALTRYSDFLFSHLNNMAKYGEIRFAESLRRNFRQEADYL